LRFLDSNVFLHALLTPRRMLTEDERRVKDESKALVKRIEEGEDVATTTVHLSEVLNMIETGSGLRRSLEFLEWFISNENMLVYPVGLDDYEGSLLIAKEHGIGANDALAYFIMRSHAIDEIYSFDKHFDQLKDIIRLTKSAPKNFNKKQS